MNYFYSGFRCRKLKLTSMYVVRKAVLTEGLYQTHNMILCNVIDENS
jgi:hypothetical protein